MVVARRTPRPSDKPDKPRPVLVTGFDPFGGDALNPSWLIAQALHRRQISGHRVVAAQLPTVFGASLKRLNALLAAHRPALVICLGLAARIADNAGAQPIDTPVVAGAPAAYFSTLPIKAMQAEINWAGIPAEVSQTAGTFVCNHVFYGLMHRLATARGLKHTRGGFIHVPMLPEQGEPSLPLEQMVEGLRIGIRTALALQHDVRLGAGALD